MISIKDILNHVRDRNLGSILGNNIPHDKIINRPHSILNAQETSMTFIGQKYSDNFDELISSTECKLIIIDSSLANLLDTTRHTAIAFITSDDPKRCLLDIAGQFFDNKASGTPSIHPSSTISDKSFVGENTSIGPGVIIEGDVTIGSNCTIGANSVIKKHTIIENNVIIGSCNVIGGDGFGYVLNETTMEYDHFPHYGGVVIKDNVHIGNNTCIDRGSLSNTIIQQGVKIDNLVHIAHNVQIGKNSIIIACSMIAGSVVIGENSWVAPSATIRNGIQIGSNSTIGLASTVTKSIEDGTTVLGSPAMPIGDFKIWRKMQSKFIDSKKTMT